MSTKFLAVIKLNTGEEVIANVHKVEELDFISLYCPAMIAHSSFSRKPGISIIKIEPWIKTGREKTYIVEMNNIITICEISDKDVIVAYNNFVKAYYEPEQLLLKPKPRMTKQMGYISNVKDARKSLEKIFKNS